jgi:phosphoglycolate phosphatase-like HAD superfamily hydrolase
MVGDAVWDAEAATEAGVPFIGLLSGGISRGELLDAGAKEVYDDARALADGLESSALASLFRR